jgi:hypothetical protein
MNNPAGQAPEERGDHLIAHHEAGHAVFALLHGLEIERVSIVPTETGRGYFDRSSRRLVEQTWVDDDANDATLAAELLLTTMAGWAAEWIAEGYGLPPGEGFYAPLDDPDSIAARGYARLIDSEETGEVVGRAWSVLKRLVYEPPVERAIAALASALEKDGEINGADASAVIVDALGPEGADLIEDRHSRLAHVRGAAEPLEGPDEEQEDPNLTRLIAKVGNHVLVVWAVLFEDTYETRLGDGYYAYVAGAYPSEQAANEAISGLSDAKGEYAHWYRWHVRSYALKRFGKTLRISPAPSEAEPTTPERLATAMAAAGLL